MHEVTIAVTLQVDDEDFILTEEEAATSGVQAITDCVDYFAQRVGFQHHFADMVSIGVASVDAMRSCEHCGGQFYDLVPVMVCDGDDWNQPEDIVHLCDECVNNNACAPGWGWSNSYNDPKEYELTGKEYPKYRRKKEFDKYYDERSTDDSEE